MKRNRMRETKLSFLWVCVVLGTVFEPISAFLQIQSLRCVQPVIVPPSVTSTSLSKLCGDTKVRLYANGYMLRDVNEQKLTLFLSSLGPLLGLNHIDGNVPGVKIIGSQQISLDSANSTALEFNLQNFTVDIPTECGKYFLVLVLNVTSDSGYRVSYDSVSLDRICKDEENVGLDLKLEVRSASDSPKIMARNGQKISAPEVTVAIVNNGIVSLSARTVLSAVSITPLIHKSDLGSNIKMLTTMMNMSLQEVSDAAIAGVVLQSLLVDSYRLNGLENETLAENTIKSAEISPGNELTIDISKIEFVSDGIRCYANQYLALILYLDANHMLPDTNRTNNVLILPLLYDCNGNTLAEGKTLSDESSRANDCLIIPDYSTNGDNAIIMNKKRKKTFAFYGESRGFRPVPRNQMRRHLMANVEIEEKFSRLTSLGLCPGFPIDDNPAQSINQSIVRDFHGIVSKLHRAIGDIGTTQNEEVAEDKKKLLSMLSLEEELMKSYLEGDEKLRQFLIHMMTSTMGMEQWFTDIFTTDDFFNYGDGDGYMGSGMGPDFGYPDTFHEITFPDYNKFGYLKSGRSKYQPICNEQNTVDGCDNDKSGSGLPQNPLLKARGTVKKLSVMDNENNKNKPNKDDENSSIVGGTNPEISSSNNRANSDRGHLSTQNGNSGRRPSDDSTNRQRGFSLRGRSHRNPNIDDGIEFDEEFGNDEDFEENEADGDFENDLESPDNVRRSHPNNRGERPRQNNERRSENGDRRRPENNEEPLGMGRRRISGNEGRISSVNGVNRRRGRNFAQQENSVQSQENGEVSQEVSNESFDDSLETSGRSRTKNERKNNNQNRGITSPRKDVRGPVNVENIRSTNEVNGRLDNDVNSIETSIESQEIGGLSIENSMEAQEVTEPARSQNGQRTSTQNTGRTGPQNGGKRRNTDTTNSQNTRTTTGNRRRTNIDTQTQDSGSNQRRRPNNPRNFRFSPTTRYDMTESDSEGVSVTDPWSSIINNIRAKSLKQKIALSRINQKTSSQKSRSTSRSRRTSERNHDYYPGNEAPIYEQPSREEMIMQEAMDKLWYRLTSVSGPEEMPEFDFIPSALLKKLIEFAQMESDPIDYAFTEPWVVFFQEKARTRDFKKYMKIYMMAMELIGEIQMSPESLDSSTSIKLKELLMYFKTNVSDEVRTFVSDDAGLVSLLDFSLRLIDVAIENIDEILSISQKTNNILMNSEKEFDLLMNVPGKDPTMNQNCRRAAAMYTTLSAKMRAEKIPDVTESPFYDFSNLADDEIESETPIVWTSDKMGIYKGERSQLLGVMFWDKIAVCSCGKSYPTAINFDGNQMKPSGSYPTTYAYNGEGYDEVHSNGYNKRFKPDNNRRVSQKGSRTSGESVNNKNKRRKFANGRRKPSNGRRPSMDGQRPNNQGVDTGIKFDFPEIDDNSGMPDPGFPFSRDDFGDFGFGLTPVEDNDEEFDRPSMPNDFNGHGDFEDDDFDMPNDFDESDFGLPSVEEDDEDDFGLPSVDGDFPMTNRPPNRPINFGPSDTSGNGLDKAFKPINFPNMINRFTSFLANTFVMDNNNKINSRRNDVNTRSNIGNSSLIRLVGMTKIQDGGNITISGLVVLEKPSSDRHITDLGTVCDTDWGESETNVVCKSFAKRYQLKIKSSEVVKGSPEMKEEFEKMDSEFEPIKLDKVQCSEMDEDLLYDCSNDGWGTHDCLPYQRVAVKCVFSK